MALENRATAKELLATERFRPCINRSYYAVYCAVTGLLAGSVTFGYGNNNPTHNALPQFILNHLGGYPIYARRKIVHSFRFLQRMRTEADYVPTATIGVSDALNAIQEMDLVCRLLEIENG